MLPEIAETVNKRISVIVDSDIRRVADIMRGKALGADFSLVGRAMAYGVGAGGRTGAERALEILKLELVRALGQLGSPSIAQVGAENLTDRTLHRHL